MAEPLLWCARHWKKSTSFIWNTVVSFNSIIFSNSLLRVLLECFLDICVSTRMPPWYLCCPQVPPSCVTLCWWLSSPAQTSYKNQLLQTVVMLRWSMVLGHLPHSQCWVPETITSKHGTKHGTLEPGWVCSASSHFVSTEPGFICLESSTRFPVTYGTKTYNKEAWGSDKVSRFKHPHARASSMTLLNHLMFVTTETEPWFENLPRGHINKVNFPITLYWGDTRNCSKNSLVKTRRPFTYEETSVKIFPCFLFSIEPQSHQGKSPKAWLKSFTGHYIPTMRWLWRQIPGFLQKFPNGWPGHTSGQKAKFNMQAILCPKFSNFTGF